jgi:two-component system, chemotaxis family, chemotaxis protein CheY
MIKRVMVVDGCKTPAGSMGSVLAGAGLLVSEVSTTGEAIGHLKSNATPDIVIADYNTDADELVREIRKLPGCQFVPVVMLSLGGKSVDEARALLS